MAWEVARVGSAHLSALISLPRSLCTGRSRESRRRLPLLCTPPMPLLFCWVMLFFLAGRALCSLLVSESRSVPPGLRLLPLNFGTCSSWTCLYPCSLFFFFGCYFLRWFYPSLLRLHRELLWLLPMMGVVGLAETLKWPEWVPLTALGSRWRVATWWPGSFQGWLHTRSHSRWWCPSCHRKHLWSVPEL